jgi:hypothetical protein
MRVKMAAVGFAAALSLHAGLPGAASPAGAAAAGKGEAVTTTQRAVFALG